MKYGKLSQVSADGFSSYCDKISESRINRYVKLLKCNNSAASYDGIMDEHLKHAMHSQLPILLYNMFKVCVKFDVLPQQCKNGILVPLLKKTTHWTPLFQTAIDHSLCHALYQKYWNTILEHFILDECEYKPCDAQFEFA